MDINMTYAYLAGAIDADGHVTIGRTTRKVGKRYARYNQPPTYYIPKVGYTGTSLIVPQLCRETFGGSVYSYDPQKLNHRVVHHWYVGQQQAAAALRLIIPHLRLKQRQAALVIDLAEMTKRDWKAIKQTQTPPYHITQEMEAARRFLWEQVTRLNEPRNRRVHFVASATDGI